MRRSCPTERASVVAGVLVFYLVLTSKTAVKLKPGQIGLFYYWVLLTSLSITLPAPFYPTGCTERNRKTGWSPGAAFILFTFIGSVAVVGDMRLILNHSVTGATRLGSHLWRMTVALFIAANSLFLGQPQVFPKAVQDSGLLSVPALLILVLLVYWLWHTGYGVSQRKRVLRAFPLSKINFGEADLE